ncbi:transposase, partial [Escherichia coli]|nr:transposase [Escherichia coli]
MIKTRRTKRTFSAEFKLEAFEQVVVKYQRDVREGALALELNPDHLRKWIRLYKQELQGIEPAGNAISPEQREIQQLKAQIKCLEMEKEILKQAAVDSIGQRNSYVK